MKMFVALLCLATTPIMAQDGLSANYILRDGPTITMNGDVEIRTTTVIVRADSAVLNTATGEIHASGNVRISPVSLGAPAVPLRPGSSMSYTTGFPTTVEAAKK